MPPEPGHRSEVRLQTAEHLRLLYTLGAGLGVVLALERILTVDDRNPDDAWFAAGSLPLLLAFVATLIPFFHGAMRHMHAAWSDEARPTPGLMMFDFVALFLQTIIFFIMAGLVREPDEFALAMALLLSIDVVWLGVSSIWTRWLRQKRGITSGEEPPATWAWVNIPTIALLLVIAVVPGVPGGPDSLILSCSVAAIAVVRTVLDYRLAKSFYFG